MLRQDVSEAPLEGEAAGRVREAVDGLLRAVERIHEADLERGDAELCDGVTDPATLGAAEWVLRQDRGAHAVARESLRLCLEAALSGPGQARRLVSCVLGAERERVAERAAERPARLRAEMELVS